MEQVPWVGIALNTGPANPRRIRDPPRLVGRLSYAGTVPYGWGAIGFLAFTITVSLAMRLVGFTYERVSARR